MLRTSPRTYALPYPAVFDAAVAVLGANRAVTSDRDRGRVERASRLRRVTVYVGAGDTTRTMVVAEMAGPLATRRALDRVVADLEHYLAWYYRPSA